MREMLATLPAAILQQQEGDVHFLTRDSQHLNLTEHEKLSGRQVRSASDVN